MAGGPLQAADDMVRIIANGLTFGLADKAASALGEQDTAAKTAAARNRAGIAGDLANVGSELYGGKSILKLGLKALPLVASRKGLAALGIGTLGAADYASRTSADAPAPKAVAVPKAAAKPTAKNTADANKVSSDILAALNEVDKSPPAFNDLAFQVAAAQGGKISLRQLGALGEIAQRTATRPGRGPQPGDTAGKMLEQQYISQYQRALNDPNADAAAAAKEFEEKVLQLRKTQYIDPYGLSNLGDGE